MKKHNEERLDILIKWLDAKSDKELSSGAKEFMGRPDRWYEPATFRCCNGHVSKRYLKSEELGYNACLAGMCREPVMLTFPEDNEDLVPPYLSRCEKGEQS